MNTNVFMKVPDGCAPLTVNRLRLERSMYAIKHAGRQ
ncbi:unnamed protein product [Sphacelaria rigidula]